MHASDSSRLLPRSKFLRLGAAVAVAAAVVRFPLLEELSAEPAGKDHLPIDQSKLNRALEEMDAFGDPVNAAESISFFRPGMELSEFTEKFREKWRPVLGDGGKSLYTPTWSIETALKVLPGIDAWLAFCLSMLYLLREEMAKTNPAVPMLPDDQERLTDAAHDIAKALGMAASYLGIRVKQGDEVFNTARITIVRKEADAYADPLFDRELGFFDAVGFVERIRASQKTWAHGSWDDLPGWIDNNVSWIEQTRGALRALFGQTRLLKIADDAIRLLPAGGERATSDGAVSAGHARLRTKGLLCLSVAEIALLRFRRAAMRSSSGVFTGYGRQVFQMEVSSLIRCMHTLEETKFGGRPIYHQKSAAREEANKSDPPAFSLPNTLDLGLERSDGAILTVSTAEFGVQAIGVLDSALDKLREHRKKLLEVMP